MKVRQLIPAMMLVVLISSCQTISQKISGNYSGTYSVSGPGITNTAGTDGSLSITADGDNQVDMVFSSSGNPNVNMSNVPVTDIFGQIIFNLNNTMPAEAEVTGTLAAGNILAITYENTIDSISLSCSGFSKQ